MNLHAKRVQKWPCTAERDETVQWAAANLVNDVRQSSFKNTERDTAKVNKVPQYEKVFWLTAFFSGPSAAVYGSSLNS